MAYIFLLIKVLHKNTIKLKYFIILQGNNPLNRAYYTHGF